MEQFSLRIKKIEVIVGGTSDEIRIYTGLPQAISPIGYDGQALKMEALRGKGVQYVRLNFNLEPNVINIKA